MHKNLFFKAGLIALLIAVSIWYAFPLEKRINLGLDLQGGMHLVLKIDTSKIPQEYRKDAPERALEVIRNRIDLFGVKEPSIHLQGEDEIVVQLPGLTDRKRALDLLGKTALLEFKLVSDNVELFNKALTGEVSEGYELKYIEKDNGKEPLLVEKETELAGSELINADVQFDQSRFGEPYVSIEFNAQGAEKFAKITAGSIGRRLAIVLDDKILSAPRINEAIPGGKAMITGRFSTEEAKDLAIQLKAGALPAPLYVEEERTVGPLLGQDSIKKGIYATIIGTAAVFVFMCVYYLFAGLVACVALGLNFLFILASLGLCGATLTLPGIAGIVLTLGMAVDANVLINERIREELLAGRPLRLAIANGYNKAFSAIFDSNITTLIAAFLLFQFGTGPIRGFAVTLSIGLLASMFTAVVVTRVIFELLLLAKSIKNLPMLRLIKETKLDFIAKKKIFFTLSATVIILGLALFFYKGSSMYGIDFSGGQLQEYSIDPPVSIEEARASLKELGLGQVVIQQVRDDAKLIIVRTAADTAFKVEEKLKSSFSGRLINTLRIENVGPIVGKQLKNKAMLALVYALLGILVYVGFRFKRFEFAAAGIAALFHDVLVTIGFLAFSGREIDLLVVTALLTIAGYSINDTIVIYDRIRELLRINRKLTIKDAINLALNQTLSRTILTSLVTLLVVIALFFFGGEILNNFAYCLLIGFISGVYSTVYIASPLILVWQRRAKG